MSYTSRWESAPATPGRQREPLPSELVALRDRLRSMPPGVRADLEPLVTEALEQARFRGRILAVAREALERMHLDLAMTRFDLEATRREREDLRERARPA